MHKIKLMFVLLMSFPLLTYAQNSLSCTGSKTGAKATVVSNDNGNITVKLDWNEGATFAKQNLEITNGTCVTCPNVGGIGKNNPAQTWTIKQTDLTKPVSLAWGTESTKKFCGTGTLNVATTSTSTLALGKSLKETERLYSPDKSHYLVMQTDGNLCIYTSSDRFVWCSMVTTGAGCRLDMQTDGHLVVYDRNNKAVWATGTHVFHDAKYGSADWKPVRMALENEGALVMYNAAGKAVWSSKTSDGKKL
ncbi:MAG: hypothetical protein JNJ90_02880 [Saprospiraceae bacterium]|jgi:hypothetical protein|nr:hypothetical protein [Saprospiraceae bacterium]